MSTWLAIVLGVFVALVLILAIGGVYARRRQLAATQGRFDAHLAQVNQVISSEELRSLVACLSTVLSELEAHVLGLYLDGHSYTGIGDQLGCDCKTVDNALQRVKRKVGAHLRSRDVLL